MSSKRLEEPVLMRTIGLTTPQCRCQIRVRTGGLQAWEANRHRCLCRRCTLTEVHVQDFFEAEPASYLSVRKTLLEVQAFQEVGTSLPISLLRDPSSTVAFPCQATKSGPDRQLTSRSRHFLFRAQLLCEGIPVIPTPLHIFYSFDDLSGRTPSLSDRSQRVPKHRCIITLRLM